MSKEIENKNKREVDMRKYDITRQKTTKMVGEMFDKNGNEHIWDNGIQGIDSHNFCDEVERRCANRNS